ncbi:MAG: RagB/SusD family nutrient uptake outer membrane protein [Gemmatimonadaceae bacterium]|nr:RagB/SusD family nutrient uptake outer membrane protein [Gemmatimonadaceae bacterium]
MRARALLPALVLAGAALGCRADVNLTNPNAPTAATFWRTSTDAQQGLTAAYQTLNYLGTFLRWQAFSYDIRSDEGTSFSPWTDLANQSKFAFANYDFPTVHDSWYDSYTGIYRANQVIARVPGIQMDPATRDRYVGEAKFLRGLYYYHLITLFGGNIPLLTQPSQVSDRPGPAGDAAIWAQIEKDFTDAAAVLPAQTMQQSGGHAVKGSAQGMLGKALLQQRKWSAAATALQPIVQGQAGGFSLVTNYADLFNSNGNNTNESLFETQTGDPNLCASQGVCGLNIARMVGPCGPSYCDGRPTRWFFQQFLIDSTTDKKVDPRAQATLFFYQGPDTPVHGLTWAQRAAGPDGPAYRDTTAIYFAKYSEYYLPGAPTDIQWDAPLNYKILRYADVLLMYAEALNEQGQTAQALPYINQVRARAHLAPLAVLSQSAMRDAILHERLLEFGLETSRWTDLERQNLLTAAYLPTLIAHDDEFRNFVPGKSERYPIPTSELNLNPNLKQNPGW